MGHASLCAACCIANAHAANDKQRPPLCNTCSHNDCMSYVVHCVGGCRREVHCVCVYTSASVVSNQKAAFTKLRVLCEGSQREPQRRQLVQLGADH